MARRSRRSALLQLLRPANVVTALADILAGYAVAGRGAPSALGWLLAASACLYAGGVTLNDVFDRHLDAVERPERPIPSGRVSASRAGLMGAALLALGAALASQATGTAALVAAAIAGSVVLYDAWGKHRPLIGPVNMGMCRALNLLLGVAAIPGAVIPAAWLGALPLTYIAAVTAVSRGEVLGGSRRVALAALVLITAVIVALGFMAASPTFQAMRGSGGPGGLQWSDALWRSLPALALTGLLAARVVPPFRAVLTDSSAGAVRLAVRTGVLSLVLLDAVIGAAYAGMIYSLAILVTALVAGRLARLFAVT